MISLLRIDDRLIHGQVAVVWSKFLNVSRIIVANDKVVNDEVQKMALSMAVPQNVKATFKSIKDSAKLVNDPRSEKYKILVVVDSLEDSKRFINLLDKKIDEINIGNYGRMNNLESLKKKQISNNVFVNSEDINLIEELKSDGINVYSQSIPSELKKYL